MIWYENLIYGPLYGEHDFNQCILWIFGYSIVFIWIMIWNDIRIKYCIKEILLRKPFNKIWFQILLETILWTIILVGIKTLPYVYIAGIDKVYFINYIYSCINIICVVMIGISIQWLWTKKTAIVVNMIGCVASTLAYSFGSVGCKNLIWNFGMANNKNIVALIVQIIIIGTGFLYSKMLMLLSLEKTEDI